MQLQSYLKERSALIDQKLEEVIPSHHPLHPSLFHAARYSLMSGGKRLRPLLVLASAETLECSFDKAIIPSLSLELIHTYSLIHDDLPCMDNDDFRRGKPSLHKAYTEAEAILTGDYLLTFAFEIIAEAPKMNSEQKIQLISCLSKAAGGQGMIGGQMMDINLDRKLDLDTLKTLHIKKTGALFSASLEFGAIIAATSQENRVLLKQVGEGLGLAFQIVDDLLDLDETRPNFTQLLGVEKSKEFAEELLNNVRSTLYQICPKPDLLLALSEKLVHRTK